MKDENEYLNIPHDAEEDSEQVEDFKYDNAATPYRISQIYKISYDANLSQDIDKSGK
jgi:hypothetical protein